MTFFKRQDIGRIYMIKMTLPDDCVIYKIGRTNSPRSTDRMMEILKSWFSYFRFIPYTKLLLDMECQNSIGIEKYIHKILQEKQFIPNFKVSGYTEMFTDLNEIRVINFLKSYNNSMYVDIPELNDNECKIICQLISP